MDTIHVLYVDDEPDLAEVVATFLERQEEQITVQTAPRAEDGLALLTDNSIDCIVSDYDMPGQTGIEFLKTVRQTHPDIPFILYTAKGSEDVASDAITAGVTDYLQKSSGSEQYELLANRIVDAVARKRAETNYQEVFEKVPDGIVIHDPDDGTFIDMNARYAEIFGYEREELLKYGFGKVLPDEPPYSLTQARQRVQQAFEHGPQTFEWPGVRNNGTRFWTEVHLTTILLHGRERVLAVVREITDRKEYEQELERTRDLLEQTEQIADVGGWEIDPETMDVFWTDHLFDLVGETKDEEPPLDEALDVYHDADRPIVEDAVESALEAGDPFDIEVRYQPVDEELRWLRVQGTPETENGSVKILRGAVQDITARKERERTLERIRDHMEFALEATDSLIWAVNLDSGESTDYGPIDRVFGSEPTGIDDFLEDVVHPADRPQVESVFEEIQNGETDEFAVEFRTTHDQGDTRWIAATAYVRDGTKYSPPQLVGLSTDITNRKRRETELQRQNTRLDEFSSVVSHDLRNPLNVAEGGLQLAQEDCDSEHLDQIEQSLTRMEALIEDLLTLSREGAIVDDQERIELSACVETCWGNVKTADASLVIDTDRSVRADESRLKQVMENLLRNSVEHGGEDVTITIGDVPDDGGFFVEDDGPGIPPETRSEVFDAGYSTSDDGTGFGLSIVKRIIEAHGWEISITEGSEGGARFEITGIDSRSHS